MDRKLRLVSGTCPPYRVSLHPDNNGPFHIHYSALLHRCSLRNTTSPGDKSTPSRLSLNPNGNTSV
ncbi:MAG: hypothetical protein KJ077_24490 [Anaerolineae bacterium]|nr:hypothetical protein [Anaerolineae bacterium]